VVCLGGDVHAHFVSDLKIDFSDTNSPVVATEFCGTSISSVGFDNNNLQKAKSFNPHHKYARSDQRGYISFTLTEKSLEARLMVLTDVKDPNSTISIASTYEVDPERPGAVLKS
jgi:alkaline phosphatase D